MSVTFAALRRLTVAQSLFPPTTLKSALRRLQFVQADPIRSPARAQDLILRHRVKNYHAGDLERRYEELGIAEDFFINYGFVTRELQALMHPRSDRCVPADARLPWPAARRNRAMELLDFVRQRGEVHPQEVDAHFAHGKVRNYWGGKSNATTHLLDAMHYQGMLRIARREKGIRVYAVHEHGPMPSDEQECARRLDALIDAAVSIYGPLPLFSLRFLVRRMRYAAPQWEDALVPALNRARERLAHANVDGADWYWPQTWKLERSEPDDAVYLLAPFDPVVWDRRRFEMLWGWTYRFEAYTPRPKRVRGYYAQPLLWRDQVIGWGNLSVKEGKLAAGFGYVAKQPREPAFKRELEAELERVRSFLALSSEK